MRSRNATNLESAEICGAAALRQSRNYKGCEAMLRAAIRNATLAAHHAHLFLQEEEDRMIDAYVDDLDETPYSYSRDNRRYS